jgi:hypothetical protein
MMLTTGDTHVFVSKIFLLFHICLFSWLLFFPKNFYSKVARIFPKLQWLHYIGQIDSAHQDSFEGLQEPFGLSIN